MPATRAQMAFVFTGALPESELDPINANIVAIPDMAKNAPYYNNVLQLYQAGITVGSDAYGNYLPDQSLTRAESAAILNRLIDPSKRKSFTPLIGKVNVDPKEITINVGESYQLTASPANGIDNGGRVKWETDDTDVVQISEDGTVTALTQGKAVIWPTDLNGEKNGEACSVTTISVKLNAEGISEKAENSIFLIEIYDENDEKVATGSGFFIESSGVAVTNYHVVVDAVSAKAKTTDGKTYDISAMLGYDEKQDIAIIKVNGKGFPALALADSSKVKNGQKIFCMGSPLGLENTISEGIISNTSRIVNKQQYIQISAPISPGSSGGAVLNESCQVIGIASASYSSGQQVNFAVPSNLIGKVSRSEKGTPLVDLFPVVAPARENFYKDNARVPDYSAVTGAKQTDILRKEDAVLRAYKLDEDQVNTYLDFLDEYHFSLVKYEQDDGHIDYYYARGRVVFLICIQEDRDEIAVVYTTE